MNYRITEGLNYRDTEPIELFYPGIFFLIIS